MWNPNNLVAVDVRHNALPFTFTHGLFFFFMVTVMIFASSTWSYIDENTLKPSKDFPLWMLRVAFYTNIPIKQGVLHGLLYGYEIIFIPGLATVHIGQRLTTLWLQFFEDVRWGQHFHMQTETVLQVIDIFTFLPEEFERTLRQPKLLLFRTGIQVLYIILLIMVTTNFITSSAYHTFKEQMLGLMVTLCKVIFDYVNEGSRINFFIGNSITKSPIQAVSCGALVLILCGLLASYFEPTVNFAVLHPTIMATCVFIGGAIYQNLDMSLLRNGKNPKK